MRCASGISVSLECKASTPDKYSSSLEVAHQYENGSFPGEGTLELRGIEEIMAELTSMLGQDAQSLTAMFMAFAEPTEDGKGLSWQYSLDKGGNLTVNNQPLGPVVPSFSP